MKSLREQAKAQEKSKLAGYGGKSTGIQWTDKGSWGSSDDPVDSGQINRKPKGADDSKAVHMAKDGGAVNSLRKPRAAGGRVAKANGGLPSPYEAVKSEERQKTIRSESASAPTSDETVATMRRLRETRAKGGKVGDKVKKETWEHSPVDLEQDKKLAKKHGMPMEKWEKSALDKKHDEQQSTEGLKKGGRAKRADGGGVFSADAKKDDGGEKSGKGKGKTVVNIVIGGAPQDAGANSAAPRPVLPPGPIVPPAPPPVAPGPMMPPPGAGPMMPPPGAGPGGPPPMMRKAGGRITSTADLTAGALSGEGRLQKVELQKAVAGKR